MTDIERALARLAEDLAGAGPVRWALVGGLAVGVRSEPRTTRDIDVAIDIGGDPDAEALVAVLANGGYRVVGHVEQTAIRRLATVRLRAPVAEVPVDLLFASSGIEGEIARSADAVDVGAVRVPVATTGHLLALKALCRDDRRRPQDADDLRALARMASPADWEVALTAARSIERAGTARGRRLVARIRRLRSPT